MSARRATRSPWVLGFRGTDLPAALGRAIAEGRVSGLILFRDNLGGAVGRGGGVARGGSRGRRGRRGDSEVRGAGQAAELRREILAFVPPGRPFVLMADEEGGLISQTGGLQLPSGAAWASVPTPRALGRIGRTTRTREVGRLLGRRLRTLGIGVDLAPCLDLDTEPMNPIIASRSFGSDPGQVAAQGWAFVSGLADAGVTGCFKHFPGHGGTRLDSHLSLPEMDAGGRRLHEEPFRITLRRARDAGAAASARARASRRAATRAGLAQSRPTPWILTAHVDWGSGAPASLDPGALRPLKRRPSRSLVITDALDMGAVDLAHGAARNALLAGNDVLLIGRDWEAGLEAIERLEADLEHDAGLRAAHARSCRRMAAVWDGVASSAGSMDGSLRPETKDDRAFLRSLHRAAVRLSGPPANLPEGEWLWILPEGLSPYVRLSEWMPPRGRRRWCAEVLWIPEGAAGSWLRSAARKLLGDTRPVLLGTLFRGLPPEPVREAWEPLLRLPRLAVIAHLLDEVWPAFGEGRLPLDGNAPVLDGGGPRGSEAPLIAFTSGPSRESLSGLAEALDGPGSSWRLRDGLYQPA